MTLAASLAARTVAPPPARSGQKSLALADALDRILHKGAAVEGNVTVGLADVDLLFLDLRLLVAAVDTIWPDGRPLQSPLMPPEALPTGRSDPPPPIASSAIVAPAGATPPGRPDLRLSAPAPYEQPAAQKSIAGGLVKLVLTLVKLLHDVLERQAVRRMENGRLSDVQIEDVGAALLAQATEIERLRRHFGFSDADLGIDLRGPDGSR